MKANAPEAREEKGYGLLGKKNSRLAVHGRGLHFVLRFLICLVFLWHFSVRQKKKCLRDHIPVLNFSVPTVVNLLLTVPLFTCLLQPGTDDS